MSLKEQEKELQELQQQLTAMQNAQGELEISEADLPAWFAKLERAQKFVFSCVTSVECTDTPHTSSSIADGLETRVDSFLSELDTVLESLEADTPQHANQLQEPQQSSQTEQTTPEAKSTPTS